MGAGWCGSVRSTVESLMYSLSLEFQLSALSFTQSAKQAAPKAVPFLGGSYLE